MAHVANPYAADAASVGAYLPPSAIARIPEAIKNPQNAEQVHQQHYALDAARIAGEHLMHPQNAHEEHLQHLAVGTAYSIGHHIQAAEIHAAGFLNANDPVAISFWIISIAMVASTVFFLMESMNLKTHWKTSMHVGALVTLIAAVHYFYMREYWVHFSQSPIVYRYIDWSLTVPLQMVEFYLILSAVNPNISGGIFWRLLLGTCAMLFFGYCGETTLLPAWPAFILGISGWGFILSEIFVGEAGKCAQQADKVNRHLKTSYNSMRFIVTIGWSIYPLGYFFGYLLNAVGDAPCNFVYNIADFINKIAFCLAIWHAAKCDTMDALIASMTQRLNP